MPRILKLITATMIFALPFTSAHAEGEKIAVVNIQTVMKESSAAKSIKTQLEAKQKTYQGEISNKENSLQKEKLELDKQKTALSKEAFEEKVKAFGIKATSMQEEVRTKKRTLDDAYEQAIGQIQKSVGEIIAEMAKERGFSAAFPSAQTLYANPSMDITADVVTKLNQKLPNYTVKFEAPAKN